MADRPIIFSAPMIRALLDGRKTQTRRLIRFPGWAAGIFTDPLKVEVETDEHGRYPDVICEQTGCLAKLPLPYAVGDRLYVREGFHATRNLSKPVEGRSAHLFGYVVPGENREFKVPGIGRVREFKYHLGGWGGRISRNYPSIHMPRWASRLTLIVTDVRVQRLLNISEDDAKAEGVRLMNDGSGVFVGREGPAKFVTPWPTAHEAFLDIWNTIHGHNADRRNPWVVAVSFTVHRANIDAVPADALDIAGAA